MTARTVLGLPRPALSSSAAGDVALAALFAVVVVLEAHGGPAGDGLGTSWWLGLVSVLPMAFRRRFPLRIAGLRSTPDPRAVAGA